MIMYAWLAVEQGVVLKQKKMKGHSLRRWWLFVIHLFAVTVACCTNYLSRARMYTMMRRHVNTYSSSSGMPLKCVWSATFVGLRTGLVYKRALADVCLLCCNRLTKQLLGDVREQQSFM